ncbi:MAG: hypothetical protein ACUVQ0_04820 [Thermoproteota archaeon]
MSGELETRDEKNNEASNSYNFKNMLLSVISFENMLRYIKTSPKIIFLFITPPMLLALRFIHLYILLRVKIIFPQLFVPQAYPYMDALLFDAIKYYGSYVFFCFLVALIIFRLGVWVGGSGEWRQIMSATGFVYLPNVIGLIVLIVHSLTFPVFQTNIITTVGYSPDVTQMGYSMYRDYDIMVDMRNYTVANSSLKITIYAEYETPLNVTIGESGRIEGETRVNGQLNLEYSFTNGSTLVRSVKFENISLNYDVPIVIRNINLNYSGINENLIIDMMLFLNNTYASTIGENFSIPYILTITVSEPNLGTRSHEVKSSFYTLIQRFPNIKPLYNFMKEFDSSMQILTLIVYALHFLLYASAIRIIHEFRWVKSILFTVFYVGFHLLLLLAFGIGFVI